MRKVKGFTPLEVRRYFLTGFTLIELLVVISILVLLMAILLPALQRVRKQARAVACQVNLKQWGTTLALYTEDSQGRLPRDLLDGFSIWFLRGSVVSSDDPNVPESLHRLDTEGIACCPMAVKPGRASFTYMVSGETRMEGRVGSTFEAWETTIAGRPFRTSYGLNDWLFHRHFQFDSSVGFRYRLPYTDIFSLKGRANIPTLLDSTTDGSNPREDDRPPRFSGHGGLGMKHFCINRHNEHINGLFLDWSVRKIGLKELWTLKWNAQFNTANAWTKAGGAQPSNWPEWMRGFKDY